MVKAFDHNLIVMDYRVDVPDHRIETKDMLLLIIVPCIVSFLVIIINLEPS